jgi:hypothetical protein
MRIKFIRWAVKITKYKLDEDILYGISQSKIASLGMELIIDTTKGRLGMFLAYCWISYLGLLCYRCFVTNYKNEEKQASIDEMFKNAIFYKSVRFDVFCNWEILHYKLALLGNEEDRQVVVTTMDDLGVKKGSELLDLMLQMADRLLDYKFWFKEIKAYRKLRRVLTPPKAIGFSGFLDLNDYSYEEFGLIDYTQTEVVMFKIHKKPLEIFRTKNLGRSIYERNAEWNICKWW